MGGILGSIARREQVHCKKIPMKSIEERIEHVERSKKVGLIPVEDVKYLRRHADYLNQASEDGMKTYAKIMQALHS